MRKFIFGVVTVAIIGSLVFAGCAAPAPTAPASTAPASTPKTTTTPTPEKPIILTWTGPDPEPTPWAQAVSNQWLLPMEEATGYRVVIKQFWAQTLVSVSETAEGVASGFADLGYVLPPYSEGWFEWADALQMPFLSPTGSAEVNSEWGWTAYDTIPELKREVTNKGFKLMATTMTGPYVLQLSEASGPITTLADWKGKVLRSHTGAAADMVEAFGATPVFIPTPDVYPSIQNGTLDGGIQVWITTTTWGWADVCKYFTVVPLYLFNTHYSMNLDKWNSLPADIQDAMMSVSGQTGSINLGIGWDGANTIESAIAALEEARPGNYEMSTLPLDELARWIEVGGEPIWELWIEKKEAKGLDTARGVLKQIINLANETLADHDIESTGLNVKD